MRYCFLSLSLIFGVLHAAEMRCDKAGLLECSFSAQNGIAGIELYSRINGSEQLLMHTRYPKCARQTRVGFEADLPAYDIRVTECHSASNTGYQKNDYYSVLHFDKSVVVSGGRPVLGWSAPNGGATKDVIEVDCPAHLANCDEFVAVCDKHGGGMSTNPDGTVTCTVYLD